MVKNHLSINLPYNNTTIGIDQTVMEISQMLKQENAKGIRWTETPAAIRGVELPLLEFVMASSIGGIEKEVVIRVKPRLLTKEVGQRYNRRSVAAPEQSMRLLYWWLKSKLEAIKYGLETVESVLLSNIIHNLPDGSTSTIGESMIKQLGDPIQHDNMLPSFDLITKDQVRRINKNIPENEDNTMSEIVSEVKELRDGDAIELGNKDDNK